MYLVLLFSLTAFNQGSTQLEQQQKTGNTREKTNSEIRALPPVTTPTPLPPTAANTSNGTIAAPNANSQQASDQKDILQNKWDHLATLLAAVATAVIAVFTWLTWRVYQEQLRVSKINERAWIVPVVGAVTPTPNPKVFQIQVDLLNNGKTPAWVIAAGSQGKGATKEKPLPDLPPYTEMKPFSEKGSLLSPNGSLAQGFPLEQERIDHVLSGQSQLYIFGYVRYRDIYGDSHITRYCFQAKKSQDANHPHPLEFYIGGPDHYTEAD